MAGASRRRSARGRRTGLLIDEMLPRYDIVERHETVVDAAPDRVLACARSFDLAHLPVTATLMAVRGIPHLLTGTIRPSRRMGLEQLMATGFVVLGERPAEELVLGVVGRFWRPASGIVRVSAAEFAEYSEPGHARAAWNFRVDPVAGGCLLRTETRVECLDGAARWRFRVYWAIIGPFSALIRREMLRAIRREAEGRASTPD